MDMLLAENGPLSQPKKISIVLDERNTELLLQNKIKIEFDVETGKGIIAKRETDEFTDFGDDMYEQMEGDQDTNGTTTGTRPAAVSDISMDHQPGAAVGSDDVKDDEDVSVSSDSQEDLEDMYLTPDEIENGHHLRPHPETPNVPDL